MNDIYKLFDCASDLIIFRDYTLKENISIDKFMNTVFFKSKSHNIDRDIKMLVMRRVNGYKYKQIGEIFGLSGVRAQQIVSSVIKRIRHPRVRTTILEKRKINDIR